jgi:hypothetical protein
LVFLWLNIVTLFTVITQLGLKPGDIWAAMSSIALEQEWRRSLLDNISSTGGTGLI